MVCAVPSAKSVKQSKDHRYSWRPTAFQLDQLSKHAFEEEAFQALVNRLLQRLRLELLAKTAPIYRPVYDDTAKTVAKVVWVDEQVDALIQTWKKDSVQATMEFLIGWAVLLPPTGALRTADEALVILQEFEGQELQASHVVDLLTHRCSYTVAAKFLAELNDRGKIKFVDIEAGKGERISLNGKRLGFIRIKRRD